MVKFMALVLNVMIMSLYSFMKTKFNLDLNKLLLNYKWFKTKEILFVWTKRVWIWSLVLKPAKSLSLESYCDSAGVQRSCFVGKTLRGRGLVASRNLAPNEEALRIPLDLALIEPRHSYEEHWTARLAKRLQSLRDTNNPYAISLPDAPRIPSRWDENILIQVQNKSLEVEVESLFFWRAEVVGDVVDLDCLDLVCSRSISLGGSGPDSLLALVPLLDMANHCPRTGGYYVKQDNDIVLLVGAAGVRKGEEITLDYGARSNDHFLLHYGFVPPNNPADSILLGDQLLSWSDLSDTLDPELRHEATSLLSKYPTSLEYDLNQLKKTFN
mmetsp:Transcript_1776/g.2357  ORF Transcript_1776/g.2357 Transcript_1776/m.2357 type:complete len:327 (+) Transcript_1776:294-1274(+)